MWLAKKQIFLGNWIILQSLSLSLSIAHRPWCYFYKYILCTSVHVYSSTHTHTHTPSHSHEDNEIAFPSTYTCIHLEHDKEGEEDEFHLPLSFCCCLQLGIGACNQIFYSFSLRSCACLTIQTVLRSRRWSFWLPLPEIELHQLLRRSWWWLRSRFSFIESQHLLFFLCTCKHSFLFLSLLNPPALLPFSKLFVQHSLYWVSLIHKFTQINLTD